MHSVFSPGGAWSQTKQDDPVASPNSRIPSDDRADQQYQELTSSHTHPMDQKATFGRRRGRSHEISLVVANVHCGSKGEILAARQMSSGLPPEADIRRAGWDVRVVPNSDIGWLYSITSSARASSVGGTVRPSALAVLRLIANSYFVGACTGRSAGFFPLRIRST